MIRRSLLETTAVAGLSIAASLATFAAFGPAHAQSSTWTGATNNDYGTAGNWSGGTPPPNSNTKSAVFDDGGIHTNVNVAAPTTVNSWTFQGTTNYALTGSAITFSGVGTPGIISTSNGTITIGNVISGAGASIGYGGNGAMFLTGSGSTIGGSLQVGSPTGG